MKITRRQLLLASALMCVLALPASADLFGPKGDNIEEKRAKVRKQRDEILAKLYQEKPEAKAKIEQAAGYGAFNNKNLNLFLLSSGHGYGVVVDKSGKETFMAMGSLGGGVGLGAKDLSVVFIFKNADVMKKFLDSGWQFGGEADATAKAGDKGGCRLKEAAADTGANVFEVYQMTDTGVALQATVAGTKYWKDKDLNK
jgi:lipid-binding SYLF domain-containing protein